MGHSSRVFRLAGCLLAVLVAVAACSDSTGEQAAIRTEQPLPQDTAAEPAGEAGSGLTTGDRGPAGRGPGDDPPPAPPPADPSAAPPPAEPQPAERLRSPPRRLPTAPRRVWTTCGGC